MLVCVCTRKLLPSLSTQPSLPPHPFDLKWFQTRFLLIQPHRVFPKTNTSLLNLDLSWNGVGTKGGEQLGEGLNVNKTLTVLDVSGCRLNLEGFISMLGKMKENSCLKSLMVRRSNALRSELCRSCCWDRLVGLVVKTSTSGAEDPGFESRLRRDFFRVESYQ